MTRRFRTLVTAAALFFGGCGIPVVPAEGGAEELPEGCESVSASVVVAIQAQMKDSRNALRNAAAVQADEYEDRWFVSAEVVEHGRREDRNGDILTWATSSIDVPAADVQAVDRQAREHTSWPRPTDDITVNSVGGIESRACVAAVRPQ